MTWQDTNQQAIEKYLADLLTDDLEVELEEPLVAETAFAKPLATEESPVVDLNLASNEPSHDEYEQQQPESAQERQLKAAMQRQIAITERPHKEPEPLAEVILPNITLPQAEEELAEPNVETLADVLEEIENQQEVEKVIEPEVHTEEPEIQTAVAETHLDITKEAVAEQQAAVTAPVEPELTLSEQPPALPPTWKNGRPSWAQERFECLLFNVKGLTLAVPLVELGGIIKIEDEPTPLFGQPSWFLGLLRSNNMNVAMVDTAQWVLPPALIAKNPQAYELIIRIHESHWGLACNAVDRSITLEPEQVRWRSSLTKRPWLAGTVIEHMCALIDVAAFDRLLKEGHGELEPANLASLKESLANE